MKFLILLLFVCFSSDSSYSDKPKMRMAGGSMQFEPDNSGPPNDVIVIKGKRYRRNGDLMVLIREPPALEHKILVQCYSMHTNEVGVFNYTFLFENPFSRVVPLTCEFHAYLDKSVGLVDTGVRRELYLSPMVKTPVTISIRYKPKGFYVDLKSGDKRKRVAVRLPGD